MMSNDGETEFVEIETRDYDTIGRTIERTTTSDDRPSDDVIPRDS